MHPACIDANANVYPDHRWEPHCLDLERCANCGQLRIFLPDVADEPDHADRDRQDHQDEEEHVHARTAPTR